MSDNKRILKEKLGEVDGCSFVVYKCTGYKHINAQGITSLDHLMHCSFVVYKCTGYKHINAQEITSLGHLKYKSISNIKLLNSQLPPNTLSVVSTSLEMTLNSCPTYLSVYSFLDQNRKCSLTHDFEKCSKSGLALNFNDHQ